MQEAASEKESLEKKIEESEKQFQESRDSLEQKLKDATSAKDSLDQKMKQMTSPNWFKEHRCTHCLGTGHAIENEHGSVVKTLMDKIMDLPVCFFIHNCFSFSFYAGMHLLQWHWNQTLKKIMTSFVISPTDSLLTVPDL